ncbi:hypothetical protein FRX31_010512 [Thalictrum thalictroides]|uniref:Uncharacterized protein n=1 Tax=Thalictrum thalictroides TaxID=46969 RepID=A0A7J6WR87_THATH|nr:hypothetical protein FRX31_010512 [Thalictrum thalictroides]
MASSNFTEEGSNSQLDINSDALSEVFGPDHKNRVRGIGSNITKKQYHRSTAAKAIIEEVNNVFVAEVRTDVTNVKTDVAGVKTVMADLKSMMQVSLQYRCLVGGKVQSSLVVPSHSAEVGSNSQLQPPIAPLNLGEMFDSVTPNSRWRCGLLCKHSLQQCLPEILYF